MNLILIFRLILRSRGQRSWSNCLFLEKCLYWKVATVATVNAFRVDDPCWCSSHMVRGQGKTVGHCRPFNIFWLLCFKVVKFGTIGASKDVPFWFLVTLWKVKVRLLGWLKMILVSTHNLMILCVTITKLASLVDFREKIISIAFLVTSSRSNCWSSSQHCPLKI